jgi:uncharacterized protein DUF6600
MKKIFYRSLSLLALVIGASSLHAGLLFYVPIPASESDPNSGISEENTYTTAVDGGNAEGTDRVINGITLYSLTGEGQSLSANSCSLTVLDGTVANGGGAAESIQADGTLSQVVSDMTFNNEANDGSEQEIVLDPESLTPGTTYDLRVYISNSSGQNREINLKFFGDGQAPVETGWFNEDDATTSPGGFKDANQVYYINYRYTWDGDTTPGIAISQRYGRTPFCLYALTNQMVPGEELGTTAAGAEAEAVPAESGGLTAGFTAASADDVGVTSDTFYSDETLNSNGEWVDVGGYGKCWRPTRVSADWRPYTNGRWGECDDCGWTWISDDDWGWCTDHYGRWTQTVDSGWCWVPGTVWSPAWVSWRSGTGSDCDCVGWAPLPPEAGCEIDVGIGNWIDYTCGLGPDAYTFVNVVDFGSDNFSRCGTCLIDRGRYVNIFEQTTNITNISYVNIVNQTNQKYVNIYNGGPDPNWCNTKIREHGGKEIPRIHVNRYDDPAAMKGGRRSRLEGDTLSVAAPKIRPTRNPQHAPKVAATIPRDKVDKGWAGIKDPKVKANLQNKIAQETKGKTPRNAPAKLPREVASKLAQKPMTAGHVKGGLPKGAVVQQPGARGGAAAQARSRPGRPGESRQKGLAGEPRAPGRPGGGEADARKGLAAPPKTQGRQAEKPGQRVGQQGRATSAGQGGSTAQGVARQGSVRPGQSLKKTGAPAGVAGQQGQQQRAPGQQGAKPGVQGKGAQQGQAQRTLQGAKPGGAQGGQRGGVAGQSAGERKGQRIQQGKAQRPGVTEAQAGAQGATQPRETKPGPAAQKKEQPETRPGPAAQRKEQPARIQGQQRQLQPQQAGAQQQAQQRQGEQEQRQRQQAEQQGVSQQQQRTRQQQAAQQQQAQQQQAAQQQRQRQQQQAAQQQQAQQQQATQQQRQRQQQQAAQQQQAQQQQAAQQQRQRQQQQAAQQQQAQQQQAAQQQRQRQQQQAAQQQAQQQQYQRQLQQQQAQQQQRQPARARPTPTPWPR